MAKHTDEHFIQIFRIFTDQSKDLQIGFLPKRSSFFAIEYPTYFLQKIIIQKDLNNKQRSIENINEKSIQSLRISDILLQLIFDGRMINLFFYV